MNRTQRQRLAWRSVFFILFVLAPPLDLFRLDLYQGHFIFLGMPWTLGVHDVGGLEASTNLIVRVFVPLFALIGVGGWLSWRYGRLYCGWLCPHFSVVEAINALMRRASGKVTLWQRERMPDVQRDGVRVHPRKAAWLLVALAVLSFALLWAVTLLTYLLPPAEVWGNLVGAELTRNQSIFIATATVLLVIEFSFARHLFCRFGCAVGLFQSLLWMANRKALVVGFDRRRAVDCADCDTSCEHACPMRLKPRQIKRKIFTCTQCQQCVQACDRVNLPNGQSGLLTLLDGPCALDVSARDFGHRPTLATDCFQQSPAERG